MSTFKMVHEWNGHLDLFGRPLPVGNPRQYLLLRRDFTENFRQEPLNFAIITRNDFRDVGK